MGRFDRAEVFEALRDYEANVARCSTTGDWTGFPDRLTEDVEYIEHAYGTFVGRDAVREWIVEVMAPFPHMRIEQNWVAYDEANDAVVFEVDNILDDPGAGGAEFAFPNITRLVYGGDGLFKSQEDIYNPARDAGRVIGAWVRAGGKLAARPAVMKWA
ncbi:nuclear transport factor 2 family protein [Skermania sp. ID1734]|uniref:nuclear transport factor 2 family protein n=1 Tax=Skermania sp. ID1734 TaxID=2597516 RepID=UPI00117F9537|nr:nuclear transport factor 2 family protein [Skermania sp. ID1734]TSE01924.1 nuclear transport factor 2 family protein [Skermania sp. ID1734]